MPNELSSTASLSFIMLVFILLLMFLILLCPCVAHNLSWKNYLRSIICFQGLFHKEFMSSYSNLTKNSCCSYLKNDDLIRTQFCTSNDSWAVVTCANLWPDWIIRIMITAKRMFTRFKWWSHKLNVKWARHVLALVVTKPSTTKL